MRVCFYCNLQKWSSKRLSSNDHTLPPFAIESTITAEVTLPTKSVALQEKALVVKEPDQVIPHKNLYQQQDFFSELVNEPKSQSASAVNLQETLFPDLE